MPIDVNSGLLKNQQLSVARSGSKCSTQGMQPESVDEFMILEPKLSCYANIYNTHKYIIRDIQLMPSSDGIN